MIKYAQMTKLVPFPNIFDQNGNIWKDKQNIQVS